MKKNQLGGNFWVVCITMMLCFWLGYFYFIACLEKGTLTSIDSIATAPFLLSEGETLKDLSEKLVSWRLCNDSKTALNLLYKINESKIDEFGTYGPGYYKVPILNHEEFLHQLRNDEGFREIFTYPQWNKKITASTAY